jgi:carboxylate-amine ligase
MSLEFHSSAGSSLGIEWELQLVDLETRQLRSGSTEVLEQLAPGGEHPKAKHELLQCCLEVITGINSTVTEGCADLAETVELVRAAAAEQGLGLMCSGTHPMTDWRTQTISPKPRYGHLVDELQWLARRMAIFGVHVHVGVRSADKAVHIVNALMAYLPHFLALSASSPYWKGSETGLASARTKVFEALPTAGLPYQLPDWKGFEDYMQTLIDTGTIQSVKEVWWDIRPHPDFGTVELRVCDGLPTLYEVGMVAALTQCLVEVFDREIDKGYTLPVPKAWIVRENKWRAVRHGLDATVILEDRSVRPMRELLAELVHELRPTAQRLGCESELERVLAVAAKGGSAQRQRALGAGGDLTVVVDGLLAEFADGVPHW